MSKKIELTRGYVALVDNVDYEELSQYKWLTLTNSHSDHIYAARHNPNKRPSLLLMHRQILGLTDPKVHTDHVNGDGLDNRRSNIRACTPRENMQNQKISSINTSGFKGVDVNRMGKCNPWRASIRVNDKNIYIGVYSTPEMAARAYDEAAIEHFGKFARTNVDLGLLPYDPDYKVIRSRNGSYKLDESQVLEMRRLYTTGDYSQVELGRMFNIKDGQAHNILTGKSWKHLLGSNDLHEIWLRDHGSAPSIKLMTDDVLEIRRLYAAGSVTLREIGEQFKVSTSHVSRIVNGKKWAHLPLAG